MKPVLKDFVIFCQNRTSMFRKEYKDHWRMLNMTVKVDENGPVNGNGTQSSAASNLTSMQNGIGAKETNECANNGVVSNSSAPMTSNSSNSVPTIFKINNSVSVTSNSNNLVQTTANSNNPAPIIPQVNNSVPMTPNSNNHITIRSKNANSHPILSRIGDSVSIKTVKSYSSTPKVRFATSTPKGGMQSDFFNANVINENQNQHLQANYSQNVTGEHFVIHPAPKKSSAISILPQTTISNQNWRTYPMQTFRLLNIAKPTNNTPITPVQMQNVSQSIIENQIVPLNTVQNGNVEPNPPQNAFVELKNENANSVAAQNMTSEQSAFKIVSPTRPVPLYPLTIGSINRNSTKIQTSNELNNNEVTGNDEKALKPNEQVKVNSSCEIEKMETANDSDADFSLSSTSKEDSCASDCGSSTGKPYLERKRNGNSIAAAANVKKPKYKYIAPASALTSGNFS